MVPNLSVTPQGDLDSDSESMFALPEEPTSYDAVDLQLISEGKLPSGARVSLLRPFFYQRASQLDEGKPKVDSLEETLCGLKLSSSRLRSLSHSSQFSEAPSSSSSIGTMASSRSVATAISSIGDSELPRSIPRIKYSDWSQFGIALFTPKLTNPNSQLHYHYPASANRPRSRSSVTQRPDFATRTDLTRRPNWHSSSSNQCIAAHCQAHMAASESKRLPLRRATLERSLTNYQ